MTAPAAGLNVAGPRWSRSAWALPAVAVVVVVGWYATHPTPLPPVGPAAGATAPRGVPVYVGMIAAADRTLVLRTIDVDVDQGEAEPRICRGGSLGVTTHADSFCSAVDPARGATLRPGDQLVLEVTGEAGDTVRVTAPHVAFREGGQWGEGSTGRPVELTILP